MRMLRTTALVMLLATLAMAQDPAAGTTGDTTSTTTMNPRYTTAAGSSTNGGTGTNGGSTSSDAHSTPSAGAGTGGTNQDGGSTPSSDGHTSTTTTMNPRYTTAAGSSTNGDDKYTTPMADPKGDHTGDANGHTSTTTTMNPRYTTAAGSSTNGDDKRTPTEQPPRTYPPQTGTSAPTCRPRIGVFAQVKSGTRVQLGSTEPIAATGIFNTAACRDASALLEYTFTANSYNLQTKRYAEAVELPSRGGKASVAKLPVGSYLVTITAKPNVRYTAAAAAAGTAEEESTANKAASNADGIMAPTALVATTRVLITVYVPLPRIVPRTATYVKVSNATAAKFLFSAEIENKGDNAASWSCCEVKTPTRDELAAAAKAGAKVMPTCEDTCPVAVKRTAASATGAVLAVKTENPMPVGYFRVTLTVGRASSAFYVRVVAQPVLRVALNKNFDRKNDRFVFYATATTGATLSWKVNEVASEQATRSGRLLTIARTSLPTGQDTTVEVTATRGDESNVASVSVPAPINAMVNCRVLREDGEESVATALATRLRIKANVSGFDLDSVESIRYRFGYARWKRAATVSRDAAAKAAAADELADMTPVFLSTTPAAVDEYNATAPLVVPAESAAAEATDVDVRFFVEVTINKDITVRGVCRHRVTRSVAATKADGDRIAKQEEARAEEAAEEGDEDAVAETVANAMTVAEQSGSAKTNVTARAAMAHRLTKVLALAVRKSKNATASAAASSGSSDGAAAADEEKKSDMTPETKANYVDILSRMDLSALRKARAAKLVALKNQTVTVAGDASAPAAPETSEEAKEEAEIAAACDDACRKEMKADVMAIVRTVLAPAADGSKVDVRANGKRILDVLSAVAPDAETNKAAVDVATTLAAQTPIGETSEIESDSITVSGASFPADSTDNAATAPAVETKDGSSLRWPTGVAIPTASADSTVSVAAVQQTTNSRPSEGLKEGETPVGRTTDFKVAVDGEEKKVADLAKPIRCVLKRLAAKNATRTTAVKYFDEATGAWSTAGISNTTDSDSEIAFDVNHLTAFGGFEEEGAAPAAQPPAANPPAANPPAANPPAANPPAANPPAANPPAANPPAANPPAGNPPAGNPPAGNPPAGQPPSGPNANPPAAAPADESSGLSTGAKIGIGAGSVVLVAAIAGMFLAARRASAQPAASTSEEVLLEMPRTSVGDAFTASPEPYRAAEVAVAQPGQKSMLASL